MMNFAVSKHILLTGAGFSHNFGGYLTSQMWEHTFNHPDIQKSNKLQQSMIGQWNFEKIFANLKKANDPDFTVYSRAVEKAFRDHDTILRRAHEDYSKSIHISELLRWLSSFSGVRPEKGFIFTLNQDLFVERVGGVTLRPKLPSAPTSCQCANFLQADGLKKFKLPASVTEEDLVASLENLNLIKLHGACNWTSHAGGDAMAIGEDKDTFIEKEPLLKGYFRLFEYALRNTKQLWIFGYGFGDKHINELIENSIEKHQLRVYVINPARPDHFHKMIQGHSTTKTLDLACFEKGFSGYIANSLKGIFNPDRFPSIPFQEIQALMAS